MDQNETIEKIKALNCGFEETKYALCYYYKDDETEKVFTFQKYDNGDREFHDAGTRMEPNFTINTLGYTLEQAQARIRIYQANVKNSRSGEQLKIGPALNKLLSEWGQSASDSYDQPKNPDYKDIVQVVSTYLVPVPFHRSIKPV